MEIAPLIGCIGTFGQFIEPLRFCRGFFFLYYCSHYVIFVRRKRVEEYRVFEGQKLRYGYTTGTCAAAAAKAATEMLFSRQRVNYIKIDTPKGITLNLEVEDVSIAEDVISCAIRKDAGDDPDDTNGILIYAAVNKSVEKEIELLGGVGVGKVTMPGLACQSAHRQLILFRVR
jgi:hypothetical protein